MRLGSCRLRHGGKVNALVFSTDGHTLASAGDDRTARLWDPVTGKEVRRWTGHQTGVSHIAFVGGQAVATTDYTTIHLWDAVTGQERPPLLSKPVMVPPLCLSGDGKILALISGNRAGDCSLRLREAATGRELHRLEGHQGLVRALAFAPDNRVLASGSEDETIRLWDVAKGQHLRTLIGHSGGVRLVVFAPNGQTLASGSDDDTVQLWDVATGKPMRTLPVPVGWGQALAFSADSRRLAVGCPGGKVQIWDLEGKESKPVQQWQACSRMVCAVAWSADGKTLATGGLDGRIRLWDVASGKERLGDAGHSQGLLGIVYLDDGKVLATAGREGTLIFWDAATGRGQRRLQGLSLRDNCVAFAPDGRTVAARKADGQVAFWDLEEDLKEHLLQGPSLTNGEKVVCLTFSADGKLLTGHTDGSVRICNRATEVRRFEEQAAGLSRLAASPDGQFVAVQGEKLWLFGRATGKVVRELAEAPSVLWSLALSPDGRELAAGTDDFGIRLWETATGQPRGTLVGHSLEVRALAYSGDGRFLASGGGDRTIRLWATATGREVARLEAPAPVTGLAFAPGDQRLASSGEDGTALVWDLAVLRGRRWAPAVRLDPEERARLWSELGGEAAKAYRARCQLAAAHEQAISFLATRLRHGTPPDEKTVAGLLADLDNDDFSVRERANERLAELGEVIEPALRKALTGQPSGETRRRLQGLLAKLQKEKQLDVTPQVDQLQILRAVEVLERVGTAEARQVLKALAAGAPRTRLTGEAQAALRRLEPVPVAPAGK